MNASSLALTFFAIGGLLSSPFLSGGDLGAPRPVDGRTHNIWNQYWDHLYSAPEQSSAVPITAMLVIAPDEKPYMVQIGKDGSNRWEVYVARFQVYPTPESVARTSINRRTREVDQKTSERIVSAWREVLYQAHYPRTEKPAMSDGTWCIIGALAPSGNRFMMAEWIMEETANLEWMAKVARTLESYANQEISGESLIRQLDQTLPLMSPSHPTNPKPSDDMPANQRPIPGTPRKDLFPPSK